MVMGIAALALIVGMMLNVGMMLKARKSMLETSSYSEVKENVDDDDSLKTPVLP